RQSLRSKRTGGQRRKSVVAAMHLRSSKLLPQTKLTVVDRLFIRFANPSLRCNSLNSNAIAMSGDIRLNAPPASARCRVRWRPRGRQQQLEHGGRVERRTVVIALGDIATVIPQPGRSCRVLDAL